jgi:hypothetical protein
VPEWRAQPSIWDQLSQKQTFTLTPLPLPSSQTQTRLGLTAAMTPTLARQLYGSVILGSWLYGVWPPLGISWAVLAGAGMALGPRHEADLLEKTKVFGY